MRKLASICLSLALVVSALALAPLAPSSVPVAQAVVDDCTTVHPVSRVDGIGKRYIGGTNVYGLQADINTASGLSFRPCIGDEDGTGVFAWIGITPESGAGSEDTIIQMGVARCFATGVSACVGTSPSFRFFWAYGGCGGAAPTPRDLGSADALNHEYKIQHVTSPQPRWNFSIDGTVVEHINDVSSAISCWINNSRRISVQVEQWDRYDSIGVSGNRTYLNDMRVKSSQSGSYFDYTTSGCDEFTAMDPDTVCAASSNDLNVYETANS